MSEPFPRRSADAIMDATFLARWADRVRASCHHCAARIELALTPTGPLGGGGVMAWIGERGDLRGKAGTAL
jgi:hypothetical protein